MSERNKSFIERHQPLTPDQIKSKIKEKEEAKKQYTTDAALLEKELDAFNLITDPLINPSTGKAMCWVRRPTQEEWEAMIPKDILQYRNNPQGIPPEVAAKYQDMTFELMEKVITNPSHNAKWWKAHANLLFIQLFQMHLNQVMNELGVQTENF